MEALLDIPKVKDGLIVTSLPSLNQIYKYNNTEQLSYAEVGLKEGLVTLFILGMGGHRYFSAYYHSFAVKHSLRLIVIDRPPHGKSIGKTDPLSFCDMLYSLLEFLNIKRFGVITHSAGALFGLTMAKNDQFKSMIIQPLILLSPWIPISTKGHSSGIKFASMMPDFLISGFISIQGVIVRNNVDWIVNKTYNEKEKKKVSSPGGRSILNEIVKTFQTESIGAAKSDALLCVKRQVNFSVDEIQQKVLIFHGTDDSTVSILAANSFVKKFQNATLNVIEKGSHTLLMDDDVIESCFNIISS